MDDYVEIKLTRGMVALVDPEWHWLDAWKWYALKIDNVWYARHNENIPDGRLIVYMHRIIMGAVAGQKVDHRNGDGLDNRRENLRFCSNSQNFQNARKRKNSTSIYKGVFWSKDTKKWRAQISIPLSGKSTHIGCFVDEIEAARAYDTMAKLLYGEFARLNNVENIGITSG